MVFTPHQQQVLRECRQELQALHHDALGQALDLQQLGEQVLASIEVLHLAIQPEAVHRAVRLVVRLLGQAQFIDVLEGRAPLRLGKCRTIVVIDVPVGTEANAASNAIGRLQKGIGYTRFLQLVRCRKACATATDDDDLVV